MRKAVLFKVKKGFEKEWRDWCNEIQGARYAEAQETLQEENVLHEASFLFEIDGVTYSLGFVEGESLPAKLHREINRIHNKKKRRCLVRISSAEVGYCIKKKDKPL